MGLITLGFFPPESNPIPEGSKTEYYFSERQQTEKWEVFTRISAKGEFIPSLVILDDGRLEYYSEERIVGWSLHESREPHHVRFSDSVFLGTGKKVSKQDIDVILDRLAKMNS